MTHECIDCGTSLSTLNWSKASQKKHLYRCSPCRKEKANAYYKDNKAKLNRKSKTHYKKNKVAVLRQQKIRYIKNTFNITLEEYERLLEASCSICGKDDDKVLDHNHQTGRIRGVLCRQCNQAIGLFKESTEVVHKAWEYMNEND